MAAFDSAHFDPIDLADRSPEDARIDDLHPVAVGAEALIADDERQSDFRDSFDLALRAFARDTDRRRPNLAPRECWPSAEHFRTILYAAGKYEGAGGARLLDRVPDPALRLFAEIELAAGLAGLEQIGGITREQG